jgi:hypothetical protein
LQKEEDHIKGKGYEDIPDNATLLRNLLCLAAATRKLMFTILII